MVTLGLPNGEEPKLTRLSSRPPSVLLQFQRRRTSARLGTKTNTAITRLTQSDEVMFTAMFALRFLLELLVELGAYSPARTDLPDHAGQVHEKTANGVVESLKLLEEDNNELEDK